MSSGRTGPQALRQPGQGHGSVIADLDKSGFTPEPHAERSRHPTPISVQLKQGNWENGYVFINWW